MFEELLLAHVEYMDIPDSGSALGIEPVTVIDPAGWVVIALVMLAAIIIYRQYERIKKQDEQIRKLSRIAKCNYIEAHRK